MGPSITFAFTVIDTGVCVDEDNQNYDYVEYASAANDITNLGQCVTRCVDATLVLGATKANLAGVSFGVSTVCRCQYSNGIIPDRLFAAGETDVASGFTCPASAVECDGRNTATTAVVGSNGTLEDGTCFINTEYSPL